MHNRDESILKRILSLRVVLIINVLLLFGLGLGLGRTYWNNHLLQTEIDALEVEARGLESKNLEISKLKKYFESPVFLEEEARLKLGLQKPGEETVIVNGIDGAKEAKKRLESINKENADRSGGLSANPKKWWKYFFH